MAVTGAEAPVVEGVDSTSRFPDYALADSGLLVYLPVLDSSTSLVWADRKGDRQPVNAPPHNYRNPRAFHRTASAPQWRSTASVPLAGPGNSDVWVVELARGTLTRLTSEGSNIWPTWTPDGRRVTFQSNRASNSGIYQAPADGSGKPDQILVTEMATHPYAWTPDGQTLVYWQNGHIWMLPAPGRGGESKPRQFFESSFREQVPALSPDGRWLTYTSNKTGRNEVYVQPFPGPGPETLISTQGGLGSSWRGREIFFRTMANELAVVEVQTSPTFQRGRPQILFKSIQANSWDVAPDGKRVLLVVPPDTGAPGGRLEVVGDWFEELRRRVPVK